MTLTRIRESTGRRALKRLVDVPIAGGMMGFSISAATIGLSVLFTEPSGASAPTGSGAGDGKPKPTGKGTSMNFRDFAKSPLFLKCRQMNGLLTDGEDEHEKLESSEW